MATSFTSRTIPTTTYGARDPIGRSYLTTESGEILTTEAGDYLIAVDYVNTSYSTPRAYIGQTWDDLGSQTWNSLSSSTWSDLYTWIAPTSYTARTPI